MIRHGTPGYGEITVNLAAQAGAAQAASKAAELAARLQEKELERKQRQEEFQMQLAAQREEKMIDTQMELEKYRRAHAWEIEKMEIASRIDFTREEQKRQQKLSEFDALEKGLDEGLKSHQLSPEEYQREKRALSYLRVGAEGSAAQVMRPPTREQMEAEMFNEARKKQGEVDKQFEGIDPSKKYTITKTDGTSGVVLGSDLLTNKADVAKVQGEFIPQAPVSQLPKAQDELIRKFGTPSLRAYTPQPYEPSERTSTTIENLDAMEDLWQRLSENKSKVTKEMANLAYTVLNKKSQSANPEQVGRILNYIQSTQQ